MNIKFKKTGKVALNYGIDGIIEVDADQVLEVSDAHALILIEDGVAVLDAVEVETKDEPEAKAVEVETKPKKRGPNKKVK